MIAPYDIFKCLAYDSTAKDEWKVTWHDPKLDIVDVYVLPKK
jgi:hypothetical protein